MFDLNYYLPLLKCLKIYFQNSMYCNRHNMIYQNATTYEMVQCVYDYCDSLTLIALYYNLCYFKNINHDDPEHKALKALLKF